MCTVQTAQRSMHANLQTLWVPRSDRLAVKAGAKLSRGVSARHQRPAGDTDDTGWQPQQGTGMWRQMTHQDSAYATCTTSSYRFVQHTFNVLVWGKKEKEAQGRSVPAGTTSTSTESRLVLALPR